MNDPLIPLGIGLILGSVGWLIRDLGGFLASHVREERAARKAELFVTESDTDKARRLFEAEVNHSLLLAETEVQAHNRLAAVAGVVPMQRKGQ